MKVLAALKKNDLTQEEKKLLQWVREKKSFIHEMNQITGKIEELSILLKHNGLNNKTGIQCFKLLKKFNKTPRQSQFKKLFEEYVNTNAVHIKSKSETILCSSDIIETTFGKYKNELSKNPMNGITDLALIIPAFTSNLTDNEIKNAIDKCTCKMLKEWKTKNLCDSLSSKRKKVFN